MGSVMKIVSVWASDNSCFFHSSLVIKLELVSDVSSSGTYSCVNDDAKCVAGYVPSEVTGGTCGVAGGMRGVAGGTCGCFLLRLSETNDHQQSR